MEGLASHCSREGLHAPGSGAHGIPPPRLHPCWLVRGELRENSDSEQVSRNKKAKKPPMVWLSVSGRQPGWNQGPCLACGNQSCLQQPLTHSMKRKGLCQDRGSQSTPPPVSLRRQADSHIWSLHHPLHPRPHNSIWFAPVQHRAVSAVPHCGYFKKLVLQRVLRRRRIFLNVNKSQGEQCHLYPFSRTSCGYCLSRTVKTPLLFILD